MGQIDLREYESSAPIRLSARERRELKSAVDSLTIEPSNDDNGGYIITASSTVGAVEIGDLSVLIRPKIGIPQLLSLACYASNLIKLQVDREFHFADDPASLPDVLALLLLTAARRAFSRGLLRGYRVEEEALNTVRGRIRFEDQIRSRFDIPIPIEVRYDEFTDDILENRLVKAAVMRLGAMRLRSSRARSGLGWIASTLHDVSNVEFPSTQVPEPVSNQLNEHYREVRNALAPHPASQHVSSATRTSQIVRLPNKHERLVPRVPYRRVARCFASDAGSFLRRQPVKRPAVDSPGRGLPRKP